MSLGRLVRVTYGVIAGYMLFVLAAVAFFSFTSRDAHAPASLGFIAISTLYGVAFAFAGGYVAMLIATGPSMRPAIVLAGMIALAATYSLVAAKGARWSPATALVFMAPAALAGGHVRRRQAQPDGR